MTVPEYEIVTMVSKIIEEFIKDWQKSPFEYNTEIDIQAEIYCRLINQLKLYKSLTYKGVYRVQLNGYKDKSQVYRRISCEYPTYYYKKRRKNYCYPDIIIYRGDINNAPDNKDGINFPMLLACEIKYETESGGDFNIEHRQADLRKLQYLINQKDNKTINGTEYALFLNFIRKKKVSKRKFTVTLKSGKVKRYDIVPLPPKGGQ